MSQTTEIEKREQDRQDNPDVVFTGKSIKDSRVRSLKDYRDSIIEAAIVCSINGDDPAMLKQVISDYFDALRAADREGKI